MGTPFVSLADSTGRPGAALTLHKDEVPGLFLADRNGNTATLATLPNGKVGLVLAGNDKNPRVAVSMGRAALPR